jgi:outer membrane immunogenic protein
LYNGPGGFSTSQNTWRNGYALGGGVEYAFTDHISAKAEYLYTGLGSQTVYSGAVSARSSMNDSLVRVGLNYRF